MSTNRYAALALSLGSIAGLVTMALHPSGHDMIRNASAGAGNALVAAVHLLALVAQPVILAGTMAITRRLRAARPLAVGASAFYLLASFAVVCAAAASGLVAPAAVRDFASADETARAIMLNAVHYTSLLNQAFARIFVLFSGFALLLWSLAMLRGREFPRAQGVFGIALGTAFIVAMLGDLLPLGIHGFGLVVLTQGIWMITVAVQLWRSVDD